MALPPNVRISDACKLFALPAITLAIAFCNSGGGSGPGASSSGTGGSGGAAVSSTASAFDPATITAISSAGQGGGPEIPLADAGIADGEVPPEPVVMCDPAADAGDADICPLPPPTCAAGQWIIYYKNPECVDGLCHFEAFAYDCGPFQYCLNGGCDYNFTF